MNIFDGTPNLHVFRITHIPATRILPSRIKIRSERFKRSIYVLYTDDRFEHVRGIEEMAAIHLRSIAYSIAGFGTGDGCMYVFSHTFEPFDHVKSFKS